MVRTPSRLSNTGTMDFDRADTDPEIGRKLFPRQPAGDARPHFPLTLVENDAKTLAVRLLHRRWSLVGRDSIDVNSIPAIDQMGHLRSSLGHFVSIPYSFVLPEQRPDTCQVLSRGLS